MRSVAWAIAVLLNVALAAAFAPAPFEAATPPSVRTFSVITVALLVAIVVLLALVRFKRLPKWGSRAMRLLCVVLPAIWLLGSLDSGIVSGQELLSLVLISAF